MNRHRTAAAHRRHRAIRTRRAILAGLLGATAVVATWQLSGEFHEPARPRLGPARTIEQP